MHWDSTNYSKNWLGPSGAEQGRSGLSGDRFGQSGAE